jgi:hypothetical protein
MPRRKLAGSLFNRLAERSEWRKPQIGEGATELCYSDRHAYTIVEVAKSGRSFRARMDKATRTDNNGMSESQGYTFEFDPDGEEVNVRWTGRGWKRVRHSSYFKIGIREKYHDFNF